MVAPLLFFSAITLVSGLPLPSSPGSVHPHPGELPAQRDRHGAVLVREGAEQLSEVLRVEASCLGRFTLDR